MSGKQNSFRPWKMNVKAYKILSGKALFIHKKKKRSVMHQYICAGFIMYNGQSTSERGEMEFLV